MAPKIINKGRQFIQHGDNVITLPFNQSTVNFLSIATIHLPRLFDMDVTTRGPGHSPGDTGAPLAASGNMTITTRSDFNTTTGSITRLKVRLHGGYGYTSGGQIVGPALTGRTERFDDIADSQVVRANLLTIRQLLAGFSLNGFGYTACGSSLVIDLGDVERFDEAINSQIQRTNATPTGFTSGYAINGFGFHSGGLPATGITEKFDDITNSWETRTVITARGIEATYGLNNFGFTSGGSNGGFVGTTQRFDDSTNTQTNRAPLNTARDLTAGYSLNGFGFTTCGVALLGPVGNVERFDDVANTQTNRANATIKDGHAGYSLNGFGFMSCGSDAGGLLTGFTERHDDVANNYTSVTAATVRQSLAGYSTNEHFINYRCYNE